MTGSESRPTNDHGGRSAVWPPAESNLDRNTIENVVERARRLRSQGFGIWLKHCFANWRSVWRRPGRAVPKTYRPSKANA